MRRIIVLGAAGVVGRQLVPMLISAGHEVHGTTRTAERAAWLRSVGSTPVVVDVFDRDGLAAALAAARPEVVIHQLTDLAGGFGTESLAANARIRDVGTASVIAATQAAGARRLIAQSIAWLYAPGPEPHVESDPLLDVASDPGNVSRAGVLALERLVLGARGIDGLVLRYGRFYGPGTGAMGPPPPASPVVHVVAAARAALRAVDRGSPGAYNVADDGGLVSNGRARTERGWEPEPLPDEGPAHRA